MIYKYLFFLAFLAPYNVAYNLEQIECPRWLPNTEEILPEDVSLSPELKLHNKMRCYCQVVKQKERECIRAGVPKTICLRRTQDWVIANISLLNKNFHGGMIPLPKRNLILNVE